MKNTKRRIEPLPFYDHTGISRHLEKMAAKGWMLEKLNGFCWQYRRMEPQQLRFAVTYFPTASQFAPAPVEGLQTFWDFCAEAGWILAADNAEDDVKVIFVDDLNTGAKIR